MLNFDETVPMMAALKVLIIEDDEELGLALVDMLEHAGMRTARAMDGSNALMLKQSFQPDIVLADVNLPDTNGFALLTLLARQGDCGIIIVSGMTEEADRILGLELGADDYICKPPHPRELLARVRAVHRRVKLRASIKPDPAGRRAVDMGNLKVDLRSRTVLAASGAQIKLTSAEFTVLETMLAANGEAVSRDSLSQAALHHPWRAEDRGVDQLIFSLRQKLATGDGHGLIHAVRGAGYMVSAAPPVAPPLSEAAALAF
jgi:DNA-binding response OmpR family regulator